MFRPSYRTALAAVKVLGTLAAAAALLAAAAFAADVSPLGGGGRSTAPASPKWTPSSRRQFDSALESPRILRHPRTVSTSATAHFRFDSPAPGTQLRCRLDRVGWKACGPTLVVFRGVSLGAHLLLARAAGAGRMSRVTRFAWTVVEPKSFVVVPTATVGPLFPGAPAMALPVRVSNPNQIPIFLTELRASVTAGPNGCDGPPDLLLTPSNASAASPLAIAAEASVELPKGQILPPTIQLQNLPVNQDRCQGAHFSLSYSGSAHG